jgi:hypothetical protein
MLRILGCSLLLCACASVPKPQPTALAGCADTGPVIFEPRGEVVSEAQTAGPSQVIWVHPPETMRGHFKEAGGHLYRCPVSG